jgi:tetratricopeptide (TPR) repeat protein
VRTFPVVVVTLVAVAGQAAPEKREVDDLELPPAQVVSPMVKVELPIPSFELPPARQDGVRTPRELRVHGAKVLDTKVSVHGYVTFAYDCVTDIRKPGESERDTKKRIEADPTLCERPKFFVGDTKTTPKDKSLWVVEVPRPYNKMELERIQRPDRNMPDRCEPNEKDPAKKICPPYKVGDEVTVTGQFKLFSPHSERNSDGLLIYEAMTNTTAHWTTPGATFPPASAEPAFTPKPTARWVLTPTSPPPGRVATRPVVDRPLLQKSRGFVKDGEKLLAHGDPAAAAGKFNEAVATWKGNHVAWYWLGATNAKQGNWAAARDAFEHATKVRDDVGMYQLMVGVARYEAMVQSARETQAKRENRSVDQVRPDLSGINFDPAIAALNEALRLEPRLWRAHYYLGKIHRATGHDQLAAMELASAITQNPSESGPYIALTELYQRWDYTDEAAAVASQGAANTMSPDLWFELGKTIADKHDDAHAIEAFSKALEIDAHYEAARMQRGLARYRAGDLAGAKQDLEDFVKNAGPELQFAKMQANQVLLEIHAKPHKR